MSVILAALESELVEVAVRKDAMRYRELPWAPGPLPPPTGSAGGVPPYPVLTGEVGYSLSPIANLNGSTPSRSSGFGGGPLGPTVNRALQDVLGWKINSDDAAGFLGALNQSFQLNDVEGAVVSKWTPRSYVVQTDLSGGVSGAQASIYTMAKSTLDQMLPLLSGLYTLDPAADQPDVTALKQLVNDQLSNLVNEFGFLSGPRVMRVHQFFRMLLGVNVELQGVNSDRIRYIPQRPPRNSVLDKAYTAAQWAAIPSYWTDPDTVLGTLGNLRDQMGLFDPVRRTGRKSFVNTVADEQNVTNFRVIIDYLNALLSAWQTSIRFFVGENSPFLGTQLVSISRQLGVVSELVDEARFVMNSVFLGTSQRQALQLRLPTVKGEQLPPIYLEDLLGWIQSFVGAESQNVIQNGGKLGLGEDFAPMVHQLCTQAYALYLYAENNGHVALKELRVKESLYKLTKELGELFLSARNIGTSYIPTR